MNNIISITTKVDLPRKCPTSKAGTKLEKIESDFYTGENEFWQIPNQVGIKTGAILKEILENPDVFEIEYSNFVENKNTTKPITQDQEGENLKNLMKYFKKLRKHEQLAFLEWCNLLEQPFFKPTENTKKNSPEVEIPEISFDNKEQEIVNHLNNIIGRHIFSNIKNVYDYHFRLKLESIPKEELIERIIIKDKFTRSFFQ